MKSVKKLAVAATVAVLLSSGVATPAQALAPGKVVTPQASSVCDWFPWLPWCTR